MAGEAQDSQASIPFIAKPKVTVCLKMLFRNLAELELAVAVLAEGARTPLRVMCALPTRVDPTPVRTGGRRRRDANSLPQVFLGVASASDGARRVTCAFLVLRAILVGQRELPIVTLGGVVPLGTPVHVTDASKRALIFRLSGQVESSARSAVDASGRSSLNDHFSVFVGTPWRAWLLSDKHASLHSCVPTPWYLEIELKFVKAMGVEPEAVDSITGLVPPILAEDAAQPAAAAPEEPPQPSDGSAPAARSHSEDMAHASADVARAFEYMSKLARPRGGGAVGHVFEPEVMLMALSFQHRLRNGVALSDGLAAAAPFFFGPLAAEPLVQELKTDSLLLPKDAVMLDACIRLDLLAMKYEHRIAEQFNCWRYMTIDSSPKLGFSWLVIREDRFMFKVEEGAEYLEQQLNANFNSVYESRLCPLSVYGRGRGSLVKKNCNTSNVFKLESPDEASKDKRNSEVYGICSDQGTEKGLSDVGRASDGTHVQDASVMAYPNALYMPEHLHIVYNALQNSVKKLPGQRAFMSHLASIEKFLSDKSCRRLFIATCLGGAEKAAFMSYAVVHCDWRWEFLSTALDKLIPLLGIMRKNLTLRR